MNPSTGAHELGRQVKTVIARHLAAQPAPGDIPDDAPLADLGLDSMRSINLLLELESAFGVTFPDELLSPATFRTAAAVQSAIARLRPGEAS